MNNEIKLFEGTQIRTVWDNEKEEWYFSVVDVVGALSGSKNPTDYLKKMRKRDELLAFYIGTNCPQVEMKSSSGKKRKILAGNIKDIFRIIQSVPSPKAEPFKMWLAEVGKERIDEIIDPELTIDRAIATYLKKGYTREWINQRLQAIQVRKELIDTWQDHGVKEGKNYAILTNEITKAWSGMTTRQYKDYKGLKKENLCDNMTTLELVLNMLAEATTTELTHSINPQGLEENKQVAKRGGTIAGNARKEIEQETGEPVITSKNAIDLGKLITDVAKSTTDNKNKL